jgi:hypothetical protein
LLLFGRTRRRIKERGEGEKVGKGMDDTNRGGKMDGFHLPSLQFSPQENNGDVYIIEKRKLFLNMKT